MHLFLTGEVQVGKSTILRKLLEQVPGSVGGFRTVPGPIMADGSSHIYLHSYGAPEDDYKAATIVAKRFDKGQFESSPHLFDQVGTALLQASKTNDWIVMDELGFMENEAHIFQSAVLCCLNGEIPILGVVKPAYTPFLQKIHDHENTIVLEVTRENRDNVLRQALTLLPCKARTL